MHRYPRSHGIWRQEDTGTCTRQTGGHGHVNRRGDASAPVLLEQRGLFIMGM